MENLDNREYNEDRGTSKEIKDENLNKINPNTDYFPTENNDTSKDALKDSVSINELENDENYKPIDNNTVPGIGDVRYTETDRYSEGNSDFQNGENSFKDPNEIPDTEAEKEIFKNEAKTDSFEDDRKIW